MAGPKPLSTTFRQSWTEAMNWSKDQGIPYPVFQNVYNVAQTRYQQGIEYSKDDAMAMLSAAAQGSPIIQEPQSSNLLTNSVGDLRSLLTSLPHLPGQLFGDVEKAAKNPSKYLNPLSGNTWQERAANPIWSLVPGYSDLATLMEGKQGVDQLIHHPLYAALDLGGPLKLLGKGASALGAEEAGAILQKGALGGAAKAVGKIKVPVGKLFDESTGDYSRASIATWLHQIQTKLPLGGIGKTARDVSRIGHETNSKLLESYNLKIENLAKTMAPLSIEERTQLTDLLTQQRSVNMGETTDEGIGMSTPQPSVDISQVPANLQPAFAAAKELIDWGTKQNKDAGLIEQVPVKYPDGTEGHEYYAKQHPVAKQYRVIKAANARLAQKVANRQNYSNSIEHLVNTRDNLTQHLINHREALTDINVEDLSNAARLTGLSPDELTGPAIESFQRVVKDYINKIETAYRRGDIAKSKRLLLALERRLSRSKVYSKSPIISALKSDITRLRYEYEEAAGFRAKIMGGTPVIHTGYMAPLRTLDKGIQDSKDKIFEEQNKLNALIAGSPPARFFPAINTLREKNLLSALHDHSLNSPEQLNSALAEIKDHNFTGVSFEKLMIDNPGLKKTWDTFTKEINQNWQFLHSRGLDPIYLPNLSITDAESAFHPRNIAKLSHETPDASYQRLLNSGTSVQDAAIQVTHYVKQTLEYQAQQEFFERISDTFGVTQEQVMQRANKMWEVKKKYLTKAQIAHMGGESKGIEEIINKELGFQAWSPNEFFPLHNLRPSDVRKGTNMIPSEVYKTLRAMSHFKAIPIIDPVTGLFKTTLLGLSPRFYFHIIFGGMGLMAGRTGPGIFTHIPGAIRMVKSGEFPYKMSRHAAEANSEDFAINFAIGMKYRKLMWESHLANNPGLKKTLRTPMEMLHAVASFNFRINDKIANMYRAMTYLYGKDKGGSEEAGLELTHKVFADLNNMTPFERSVISRMFPFWGWTKHLIRYLSTYPADHPYRASILASLSEQWLANWQSGVPGHMALLFDMGNPDPVTGNFNTVDFRQINPFRDSWNLATYAGWNSGISPLLLGAESTVGINTLNAAPNLYPQLNYSSFYGSNQPTMSVGQRALGMAEAIVPQSAMIDALFNVSYNIKTLKQYDPQAYKKTVFELLNVPELFAGNTGPGIGPIHLESQQNIYQIQAKSQEKQWTNLKSKVTEALTNGDFSELMGYSEIPWGGEMISPQQLMQEAMIAEQGNQGIKAPPIDLLAKPIAKY